MRANNVNQKPAISNHEQMCFGCSKDELLAYAIENRPKMTVMSILSDAQAEMELGDEIRANQYINRAKYIINECMKNTHEE